MRRGSIALFLLIGGIVAGPARAMDPECGRTSALNLFSYRRPTAKAPITKFTVSRPMAAPGPGQSRPSPAPGTRLPTPPAPIPPGTRVFSSNGDSVSLGPASARPRVPLAQILADQVHARQDGRWALTEMDAAGKLRQRTFDSRGAAEIAARQVQYPLQLEDRVREAETVLNQNGLLRPDPFEADVRATLQKSGFREGPGGDYALVASRSKSVASARRKLQTYAESGLNIADMADFVGKRIVAKDQPTAEAIATAAARAYEQQQRLLAPLDRIERASGYRAFHIDARLRMQDVKVPMPLLRRAPFELQIIPRAAHQVYELDHIFYEFSRSRGRLDSGFHQYPPREIQAVEAYLKASYRRAHAIDDGLPAAQWPASPSVRTLPAWFRDLARQRNITIPNPSASK